MSTFIFNSLLGCALIALGIHSVRHPDSWMFRRFRDIGNDGYEPSEVRIWYLKLIGKIVIAAGTMMILLSAQFLVV